MHTLKTEICYYILPGILVSSIGAIGLVASIYGAALWASRFGRAKHYPANQILDNSQASGIGDRLNSFIIVTKNNFVTKFTN